MCSCMHISMHIGNCRCVTRGSHSAFTEVELVTLAVTAEEEEGLLLYMQNKNVYRGYYTVVRRY